jgi:Na+-translocating ferredoxin:NAD+ oxidoreductase subunit C
MKIVPGVYGDKRRFFKDAVNAFLPRIVTVPLAQERGYRCSSLVKKGDIVREGQIIAVPHAESSSRNPAKIHSPVPGIVEDIVLCTEPDGRQGEAVKIKMGGTFTYLGKKKLAVDWTMLPAATIIQQFSDRGVVNTFNTLEPESIAYEIDCCKNKKTRLLVVRMYDDDPTRVTDSLLSSMFLNEIYTGALITARALEAEGIVFLIDSKYPVPEISEKESIPIRFVKINTIEYPAGFQEEIRKIVKKTLKEYPFSDIAVDDLYTDASTMYEVCSVIKDGIPVIDKYVYVSGECIPASGMLKVRIGTSVSFLAQQCGGFTIPPAAVIINGLIRGWSSGSLDTPITKYVKSVSFLSASRVPDQRQSACIRCGLCRSVCPRKLTPDILYRHASGGTAADEAYVRSAQLCSNCGLCNFVCPSRLPVSQAVKLLKKQLTEEGVK